MHNPLTEFLARRPLMILDGALATELEQRGADIADPLWSARCLIERPDLIRAVHLDYFLAGADVATTATYQATFEGFARRGIAHDEASRLMRRAVSLACEARDEFWSAPEHRRGRLRPLVAASIGPYGAMLADGSEYRGRYSIDDQGLADFHRPRLQVLAAAGADLFAIETLPCLREARVVARLLGELPGAVAWVCFSCRDGLHDSEGEDIGDCAAALSEYPEVAAVGINCTAPRHISSLLARMQPRTDRPLVAYPNSGEVYDASDKRWNGDCAASPWCDQLVAWRARGARLIGGCCRTRPADIAAMARCA